MSAPPPLAPAQFHTRVKALVADKTVQSERMELARIYAASEQDYSSYNYLGS